MPLGKSEIVLSVPPMRYSSQEQEDRGRRAYEEQKADRERNSLSMKPVNPVLYCIGLLCCILCFSPIHINAAMSVFLIHGCINFCKSFYYGLDPKSEKDFLLHIVGACTILVM